MILKMRGLRRIAAAGVVVALPWTSAPPARAESEVVYRVWADADYTVTLMYRFAEADDQRTMDTDPMAYNRFIGSMQIGSEPWEESVTMLDPARWAWVRAGGRAENAPKVHCQILVDGRVLAEQSAMVGVGCGQGRSR